MPDQSETIDNVEIPVSGYSQNILKIKVLGLKVPIERIKYVEDRLIVALTESSIQGRLVACENWQQNWKTLTAQDMSQPRPLFRLFLVFYKIQNKNHIKRFTKRENVLYDRFDRKSGSCSKLGCFTRLLEFVFIFIPHI